MKRSLEKTMLKIARDAIMEQFTGQRLIDTEALVKEYPRLAEPGAVFVTLNEKGHLRGCIGSVEAHRPLIEDIIHNARAAAFSDSRFLPVEQDEMDDITIEISLLSEPEEIFYTDEEDLERKVVPGADGIILSKGFYRAVFLPQVWEKLPDFLTFFNHLCRKAGLNGNCLADHPDIYRFRVTIVEEEGR